MAKLKFQKLEGNDAPFWGFVALLGVLVCLVSARRSIWKPRP